MFALLTGFLLSHGPKTIHLIVDGVPREALVLAPTQVTASTPVIFGFHGHMGTAFQASRSFGLQNVWPQALCVYPQGLPTATKLYDPEGKFNGWDVNPAESNKDIRFFDALYQAVFQQYGGDRRHTYAMGHSNGGYFMYTLWQMRPGAIAAFGSFEAAKGVNNPTVPKPLFVSIGSRDALVAPFLQRRSLKPGGHTTAAIASLLTQFRAWLGFSSAKRFR